MSASASLPCICCGIPRSQVTKVKVTMYVNTAHIAYRNLSEISFDQLLIKRKLLFRSTVRELGLRRRSARFFMQAWCIHNLCCFLEPIDFSAASLDTRHPRNINRHQTLAVEGATISATFRLVFIQMNATLCISDVVMCARLGAFIRAKSTTDDALKESIFGEPVVVKTNFFSKQFSERQKYRQIVCNQPTSWKIWQFLF